MCARVRPPHRLRELAADPREQHERRLDHRDDGPSRASPDPPTPPPLPSRFFPLTLFLSCVDRRRPPSTCVGLQTSGKVKRDKFAGLSRHQRRNKLAGPADPAVVKRAHLAARAAKAGAKPKRVHAVDDKVPGGPKKPAHHPKKGGAGGNNFASEAHAHGSKPKSPGGFGGGGGGGGAGGGAGGAGGFGKGRGASGAGKASPKKSKTKTSKAKYVQSMCPAPC